MLRETNLLQKHNHLGGIRYEYQFPNGYGASVVKNPMSYGGQDDLWELAVLKEGKICYDTPITDDVIGYLSDEGVNKLLNLIEKLDILELKKE